MKNIKIHYRTIRIF